MAGVDYYATPLQVVQLEGNVIKSWHQFYYTIECEDGHSMNKPDSDLDVIAEADSSGLSETEYTVQNEPRNEAQADSGEKLSIRPELELQHTLPVLKGAVKKSPGIRLY